MTALGSRPQRLRTAAVTLLLTVGAVAAPAAAFADDDGSGAQPTQQAASDAATDTPSPSASSSPSSSPSSTASDTPSTSANATSTSLGLGTVTVSPTTLYPGQAASYAVVVTNTGSTTVTGLSAVHARSDHPTGWCGNTTLSPGQVTTCHAVAVATTTDLAHGSIPAHSMTVSAGTTKVGTTTPAVAVVRDCRYNAPDDYTPLDTSWFNFPFNSTASRNNIRNMALRSIRSTPACQAIRIAAYSINDNVTVDALIAAANRGVSVQVVADSHNISGDPATQSPSLKRLIATLNRNRTDSSYVKICSRSCRGSGGNHHYKMYLFSEVGKTHPKHYVTMAGSANLTMKAAGGQWNHLDVYTSPPTYSLYAAIFKQLQADRPAATQYVIQATSSSLLTWFFPRPTTTATNDPLMTDLSKVSCTGSAVNAGRTRIRIGMYAWYESRGLYLAKRVRALWNAGCDIAIEYAVMGNSVKQVLYSPAGRGRIPMRQVATYYRDGTVADYDHQKFITLRGHYSTNTDLSITWAGTTNFSNLGLYSDDLTQRWVDKSRSDLYSTDFYNIWRGPHVRVPSPTSALPGKVGQGDITFGKGKYRNLEAN